jgi:hypothetical protein
MGLPEMWVEDVAYSDIAIYLDRDNTEAGESDMAPDIDKLCRAGFVFRNVRKLRMNNIQVFDATGPAVSVTNAQDVTLSGVALDSADSGSAATVELRDVDGAYVHGCSAPAGGGTGDALRTSGDGMEHLVVGHNRGRSAT